MLKLVGLEFAYQEQPVIHDCDFHLNHSTICHLQGVNGSGKSTLLKCIASILKPSAGTIERHCLCSYIGHQLAIHPLLTVIENLKFSFSSNENSFLQQLLKHANLSKQSERFAGELSVGQRHKLALCRLVLEKSDLWLLDEPFANLDEAGEQWLWSLIEQHQKQGGSVILTAHQRDFKHRGVLEWVLS
jgi:heme exporter protein A